MNIVVCVKQVPDTTEVKIDPVTHTLVRQGVPSIMNPFDKHAVEEALRLRDRHGGIITAISMGPPQAADVLKECLSMGVDEAVLMSDRAFGGADTLATSHALAAGIQKLGKVDLILCGKQAIDGDTAQVGPEIAEHLGMAQISYVEKVEVAANNIVTVRRAHERGTQIIEGRLPLLLTVERSLNEPRLPTIYGQIRAKRTQVTVWTMKDIDVDPAFIGLKGSPTQVSRIFTPPQRTQGEIIDGADSGGVAKFLADKLAIAKCI